MTAIFVGFADAVLCLIFNIVYRTLRPDFSSAILNVSIIIFGMMLVFMLVGFVYVVIRMVFRHGDLIFAVLMAVLTVIMISGIQAAHLSADPIGNASLRGEFTAFALIAGLSAAIGIPLLHGSHKFELYVV